MTAKEISNKYGSTASMRDTFSAGLRDPSAVCDAPCFPLRQGERLSHAVGCAFAACLERKQRREKECGVTASFDASRTSFVREGSFRGSSTCSQQGSSSSERDEKLPDKKKGSGTLSLLARFPFSDLQP